MAYLTGFLRQHVAPLGTEATQADASIALFLRLFTANWRISGHHGAWKENEKSGDARLPNG